MTEQRFMREINGAAMQELYWRAKAEQCRRLAGVATTPELREALKELAREFEKEAAACAAQRGTSPGAPDECL